MLYDVETRLLIAREHVELLRAEAALGAASQRRVRRWLSERLIAAGHRLCPECQPGREAVRGAA